MMMTTTRKDPHNHHHHADDDHDDHGEKVTGRRDLKQDTTTTTCAATGAAAAAAVTTTTTTAVSCLLCDDAELTCGGGTGAGGRRRSSTTLAVTANASTPTTTTTTRSHSPLECPLKRNLPRLVSALQTVNDRLLVLLDRALVVGVGVGGTTTNAATAGASNNGKGGSGSGGLTYSCAPVDDDPLDLDLGSDSSHAPFRSPSFVRLSQRKALIECFLHKMNVKLTFLGADITSFDGSAMVEWPRAAAASATATVSGDGNGGATTSGNALLPALSSHSHSHRHHSSCANTHHGHGQQRTHRKQSMTFPSMQDILETPVTARKLSPAPRLLLDGLAESESSDAHVVRSSQQSHTQSHTHTQRSGVRQQQQQQQPSHRHQSMTRASASSLLSLSSAAVAQGTTDLLDGDGNGSAAAAAAITAAGSAVSVADELEFLLQSDLQCYSALDNAGGNAENEPPQPAPPPPSRRNSHTNNNEVQPLFLGGGGDKRRVSFTGLSTSNPAAAAAALQSTLQQGNGQQHHQLQHHHHTLPLQNNHHPAQNLRRHSLRQGRSANSSLDNIMEWLDESLLTEQQQQQVASLGANGTATTSTTTDAYAGGWEQQQHHQSHTNNNNSGQALLADLQRQLPLSDRLSDNAPPIASRTRKHDLRKRHHRLMMNSDDLEKYFLDSSSKKDDLNSDSDYAHFIRSLTNDAFKMDGFDFDDENDDDLHSEDLRDIVEPEEEYREGPDYTIGPDELAELLHDHPRSALDALNDPVEPLFSEPDRQVLASQLQANFQIVFQNYAASLEDTDNKPHGFWEKQLTLMKQINDRLDPKQSTSLKIKGMQKLGMTMKDLRRLTLNRKPKTEEPKFGDMVPLPMTIKRLLQIYKAEFDPALQPVPHSIKKPTCRRFADAEDRLLHIGICQVGPWNWQTLEEMYIPSRSAKQIATHCSKLKNKKALDNSVKDFFEECKKQLTENEKSLLRKGISLYGDNFDRISRLLLPRKPPSLLRCAWNVLGQSNAGTAAHGGNGGAGSDRKRKSAPCSFQPAQPDPFEHGFDFSTMEFPSPHIGGGASGGTLSSASKRRNKSQSFEPLVPMESLFFGSDIL